MSSPSTVWRRFAMRFLCFARTLSSCLPLVGFGQLASADPSVVAGWGTNEFGQLSPPDSATNLIQIEAGYSHILGLRHDRRVVAWCDNGSGQAIVPAEAVQVIGVSAGSLHSLALRTDGTW